MNGMNRMKTLRWVNESATDRVIRVLGGLALGYAALGLKVPAGVAIALGIVAAVAVVTGFTGFCLIYRLFGLRTCPVAPAKVAR